MCRRVGRHENLVEALGSSVAFYKVGLELFLSGDVFELLDWLVERGKKIFVDLKFFDVPATVARAVKSTARTQCDICNSSRQRRYDAGSGRSQQRCGNFGSDCAYQFGSRRFRRLGLPVQHVGELVCSRARRAMEHGCVGVVASGQEAAMLRQHLDESLLIVTPGIRPVINDDDQKRTVTASRALHDGADYIVVGRPIRDAVDPRAAAESLQIEIAAALAR